MRANNTKIERELKKAGFKPVPEHESLLISNTGKVYDLKAGKYLKPTARNYIKPDTKYLNVPKLVLMTFAGKESRNGQIHYKNGNKADLTPANIKYKRLYDPKQTETVNKADLLTAIRCYFEVEKKYKPSDTIGTNLYLKMIADKRGFYNKSGNIAIFKSYIDFCHFGNNSIAKTAQQSGLSVRDCTIIINQYKNQLINEVLTDLKVGKLKVHEYEPRKKTEKQHLKEFKAFIKSVNN